MTPLVGKRVSTFAVTPAVLAQVALLLLGPRDERLHDAPRRRTAAPADLDRERLLVPGVRRELAVSCEVEHEGHVVREALLDARRRLR